MAARSWSGSAGSNTTVAGVAISEGMARADVNNAMRAIMAELAVVLPSVAVSPLEYGAVGDGVANDTTAINTALATGKTVIFPKGYTFLTSGLHQCTTNYQRIINEGTVKYTGARTAIGGGLFGVQGIFQVQDQVEGVYFGGSGVYDGNRALMTSGDAGAGIYAYRAIRLTVDGPMFQNFIETGIKAFNCPDLVVTRATRFFFIFNIGVEIKSYLDDPRTGVAWVGTVYAPSGDVSGFYDYINDGLLGAGNGCGVDFSALSGALPIHNLRISGTFRDVLLAIWSENNYAGSEAYNIVIDRPTIQGNYRGSGTTVSLSGIGMVGVENSVIIAPTIKNCANVAPAGGSQSAGIQLIQCDGIDIIGANIVDDTAHADRMQYAIRNSASTNVNILGGRCEGASIEAIFDANSPTKSRIVGVQGAGSDETWGALTRYVFALQNVPTSSAPALLLADGEPGVTFAIPACAGRVVCMNAMTSAVGAGNYSIRCYTASTLGVGGNEQTGVTMSQADFSGQKARKKVASQTALQTVDGGELRVEMTTDGSWVNTVDVRVEVFVDHEMKL